MITTSRELNKKTSDVCIIGSGAAGITLAITLARKGKSVLLLESGGKEFDPEIQTLNNGTTPGIPLNASRLRYLGGTTNHWTGIVARMSDRDWPINFESYYPEAENIIDYKEPDIKSSPLGFDKSRLELSYLHYSGPVRFGEKYLEELRQSENITVVLRANVNKINFNPDFTAVTSLECTDHEKKTLKYSATRYVVACGAVENAALLLRSGLDKKLPDTGCYLMDHPITHCAEVIQTGALDLAKHFTDTSSYRPYLYHEEACCYLWQESSGLSIGGRELRDVIKGNKKPGVREIENIARDMDRVLLERFTDPRPNLEVVGVLAQKPERSNNVSLSDEKDYLGNNLPKVNWKENNLDALDKLLLNLGLELGRLGVGRVRLKETYEFSDYNHPCGTTAIGRVVDNDLKVSGTDNLYVAGASVFPKIGLANPTLTIVALALKLADTLG